MATKKEADGEHPSSHYLVVEDPNEPSKWHLRVRDTNGKPDHRLMGAAWAALHGGYRGNKYEGPNKEEAISKLKSMYRSEGMELPSDTSSEQPRLVFMLRDASGSAVKIPIAVTGAWSKGARKFSITLDHLRQMAANFRKRKNGEVNVDYEHASEMPEVAKGDAVPSAGRAVEIEGPERYTDSDGVERWILWGRYEPTERARALIQNREYRWISPAIDFSAIDKETGEEQGATLTSIALTNRPFLEELPEVHLSDRGFRLMDAQSVHVDSNISKQPASAGKEKTMKRFKVKKLADGEHKGQYGVFDDEGMVGLAEVDIDENDKTKASEAMLKEIGVQSFSEAQMLIERGKAVNAEAQLLAETVNEKGRIDVSKLDALLDSGRIKPSAMRRALEAEERARAAFAAGKIHPQELQRATRLCLSDGEAFKAFVEGAKPFVDTETRGATAPPGRGAANIRLNELIEKRMKDANEDRAVAELNVIRTREGLTLWEEARKEMMESETAR